MMESDKRAVCNVVFFANIDNSTEVKSRCKELVIFS